MRPLSPADKVRAWQLLLAAYAARRSPLSEIGFQLCRQQWAEGRREPELVLALGHELLRRKATDRDSREVLLALGALDDRDALEARRAVVRSDARHREFSPSRLEWYREALGGGSLSAAFLLAVATLKGKLDDPAAAPALKLVLQEATEQQWQAMGLDRALAQRWLVRHYVKLGPDAVGVPLDAPALVEEQLRREPDNVDYLRFLAQRYRPSHDARALGLYLALFRAAPNDPENTEFLARSVLSATVGVTDPTPILARWLALGPDDPTVVLTALATSAANLERDDDEAYGWLEQAREVFDHGGQVVGWLAVCRARHGRLDDDSLKLYEACLFDDTLPALWRAEAGQALLAAAAARGEFDENIAERTWLCLPPERQPDDLARELARRFRAKPGGGRTDGAAASVYRKAYELDPDPELARLLARAYLQDERTPVRDKIAHWRGCLGRGEADAEVTAALAKAYASLGTATEAAIDVALSMPDAQQGKLLEDLCRYRFRRGDFSAAETMAAKLVGMRRGDPEAAYILIACRVRRMLERGDTLADLDLTPARAFADHPGMARLLTLVDAALGRAPEPAAVATALQAGGSSAQLGAARVLLGERPDLADIRPQAPQESLLLALAEQVLGDSTGARARVARLPEAQRQLGGALVLAHAAYEAGRFDEAARRLLPVLEHRGPPYGALRRALTDVVARHGAPELVNRLRRLMTPEQELAAELRQTVADVQAEAPGAWAQLAQLETATNPAAVARLQDALWARRVARCLERGDLDTAERELPRLERDDPALADCTHWLQALLARRRGQIDASWDRVARLSPEARSVPAVAWTTASWHLEDGLPARAEAELSHALRTHRDDPDLLYAVVALDAAGGRAGKFLGLAEPLLAAMPAGDPRRESIELLSRFMSQPLTQVRVDDLLARAGELSPQAAAVRLRLVQVVAAAHLRARQTAAAVDLLAGVLTQVRGVALASPATDQLRELRNLLAYGHYLASHWDAASEALEGLVPRPLAGHHNLAMVAEATEQWLEAARLWDTNLPRWEELNLDAVSATHRESVLFGAHARVAEHYLQVEQWREALGHLEACLKTRPYDILTQRKCIPVLIALGDHDVALHKSSWLLTARPHDLDIHLDHALVLASARGGRAAAEYLTELERRWPEASDALKHKRGELKDRMLKGAQQRALQKDFMGWFSLAREVEQLSENDEERAKAICQQVVALYQMAGHTENAAVLEQAQQRCDEALSLTGNDRLRAQLQTYAGRIAERLAPELVRQAEELLKHRKREYNALGERSPAAGSELRQQVASLAEAFGRVRELYERAQTLGGEAIRGRASEGIAEAKRLREACLRLQGGGR